MELEQRGVPTVTVCTDRFVRLGDIERRTLGMPELPMAITSHPIGGLKAEAVQAKANDMLEPVVQGLTGPLGREASAK